MTLTLEARVLTAGIWEMEREPQRGVEEIVPLPHAHPVATQPCILLQNPGNWKPAALSSCPVVLEPQEVMDRKELQALKVRDAGKQAGTWSKVGRLGMQ